MRTSILYTCICTMKTAYTTERKLRVYQQGRQFPSADKKKDIIYIAGYFAVQNYGAPFVSKLILLRSMVLER